jgi:HEAT repeat protein
VVRKKPDARAVDGLIEVLRDLTARVDERDDAAIDLGKSDDPVALQALLDVARDSTQDAMVLGSVGESPAEIAVRNRSFERSWLEGMTKAAAVELTAALGLPAPGGPESSPTAT